ncbi:zf-HC2 domain-containing protein [Nocardioides sp. KIGAM211]|uniref:Zf-HC2 domain-containing protein n=1 Tax=Nocardioides luti TaxID=2761101 RepID=A0A7X0RL79_9ACTN|nr:zf-HC2 domain-containing protein [Nocardioides luti]
MTCPHQHLDGAYVLGALAPAERQEFEQHLTTCADCSRAVRELAGLPGLLGHVDPAALDDTPAGGADADVPATLLPALVREVRRTGRRRRWAAAGLAAAATVLVVLGSLAAAGVLGGGDEPGPTAPPVATAARSMAQVEPGPVTATVSFTDVAWGTRLDLVCSYSRLLYASGAARPTAYALVVTTRDGRTEQVATWRALPGRTMTLEAATAARRSDITAVEVRTAAGEPVLRLAT